MANMRCWKQQAKDFSIIFVLEMSVWKIFFNGRPMRKKLMKLVPKLYRIIAKKLDIYHKTALHFWRKLATEKGARCLSDELT